jgi:hypothetical protein
MLWRASASSAAASSAAEGVGGRGTGRETGRSVTAALAPGSGSYAIRRSRGPSARLVRAAPDDVAGVGRGVAVSVVVT